VVLLGALLVGLGGEALAQPLDAAACVAILGPDTGASTVLDAARHNLTAGRLRGPTSNDQRQAAEALLSATRADGTLDAGRLCATLEVTLVRRDALLTGYYRPLVPARRVRDDRFRYPLYALPAPEWRRFSREQIDGGALDGRGPVVAWLADPIEVFFIHVQGSAVLQLPDGRMAVGFAGSNDLPYTGIGALLVSAGKMAREDVTMESLKAYLRSHPGERDAILHANDRYIFFEERPDVPLGSLGVPLTDGRSVAADPAAYAPGSLLFIRPLAGSVITPRLVFVQDSGSAIVGTGRLDLYVGTGDDAAAIAGPLQDTVDVFVVGPR